VSDYAAALAALTDEEQALFAQETRDTSDLHRLEVIRVQRAMILELKRRHRPGHAPQPIPTIIPIDLTLPEEEPAAAGGAAQLIADLIAYKEAQS
jgi:hypothetical protein